MISWPRKQIWLHIFWKMQRNKVLQEIWLTKLKTCIYKQDRLYFADAMNFYSIAYLERDNAHILKQAQRGVEKATKYFEKDEAKKNTKLLHGQLLLRFEYEFVI
jgi:hypothetical protein